MAQTRSHRGIPRRARIYFGLAFVAVLSAALLWHSRVRSIDLDAATSRANGLLALYVRDSGEPPAHFIAPTMTGYPDGWEFAWRYRPCPEVGVLKIFIRKSGSADYSALPDCSPQRDYAVRPRYA